MKAESNYVLDPVCGMRVDPQKAAAIRRHIGQTFHFCSLGCAKAFDEDPHSFLEVPSGSEDD
jgi:Cu+-exporting ATPase